MKKNGLIRFIAAFTTALLITGGTPAAFAALQIYKVKGNVTVKGKSKAIKAERKANVAETDLLTIPKGASIDILNTDNRRIYSSRDAGKMTVKTLIEKANAHATDITGNINRKVMAAVADNAGEKRSGYNAMGMAIHETDAIALPPIAVPEGVSYLDFLMTDTSNPDSAYHDFMTLRLEPSKDDDGTFCFTIDNHMHETLFFNIIEKTDDNDIRLFFPINHIAAPKTTTTASEYRFAADPDGARYVAIASDIYFTLDDIMKLLEPGFEPEEDYYLSAVTAREARVCSLDELWVILLFSSRRSW